MLSNYPRSFGRLLAIGFTLVTLPLILALIGNAITITRLADRGERAVDQAAHVTQASRHLAEAVAMLEHNARQLLILPDAELLEVYRQNRDHLRQVVRNFNAQDIDDAQRSALEDIVTTEDGIFAALSRRGASAAERRQAVDRFARLDALVEHVVQAGAMRIDRETAHLHASAMQARQTLYLQLIALVPLVFLTAIGFAMLIGRPLRMLDAAIHRIGSGRLAEPVVVKGPQSLQALGVRLEWMRGQLVQIELEKDRFLREIAHALKTPLAALREGSALLNEQALGKLTPEQREVVEILHRNGLELQRLIEGLLDYNAAQFKRAALRFDAIDLRQLIDRVAENHKLLLQARRLTLVCDVPEIRIRADTDKLLGILDNLLSNAIKYSPDDKSIFLTVSVQGQHVVIDIADQGMGVAPEDRPHIFDPFYRGRTLPSGRVKGSGIGLSIVREYAVAHGGSVELIGSRVGAHFRATLVVEVVS